MNEIEILGFRQDSDPLRIPFFLMAVSAGTPVEVNSEVESEIDLNEFLVDHPAATFFAKVKGNMMAEVGIKDGDILIVDSAVEPTDGRIVVTSINENLAIKYFRKMQGQVYLESQDSRFLPLDSGGMMDIMILGTVTKVIHSF